MYYLGLRNVRTMPSICEDPNAPGSGLDPDSKDPKADPESKVRHDDTHSCIMVRHE